MTNENDLPDPRALPKGMRQHEHALTTRLPLLPASQHDTSSQSAAACNS
eukprot:CAMPEP_0115841476 /NCGR_PEP_ID=MMETSP0287-20121206/7308_1 /TAXON_ID=412157 /ORGANISM="Chrysochromulina rotalis, Strain UIO044" /LENGTH=48 /DNA_ID= /DNA_START= /DNA_END= /DNA_ORIENTATION=